MPRSWSEAVKACRQHPSGVNGRACRCRVGWRYRLAVPDPVTGKRGRPEWSVTFPTKEAADDHQRQVRQAIADGTYTSAWLALSRERNQRVRLRLRATAWVGGLTLLAVLVVALAAPWWVQVGAAAVVVGVLARLGTAPDRPIVGPSVTSSVAPRLTSDVIVRALTSLGLAGMTGTGKTAPVIAFVSPVHRDGPGWRADVDLPHGITWSDVADRRDRLASGLRRPLSAVWVEGAPDQHAGRLVLWCGDRPLSETRPPAWPLLKAGTADYFAAAPFGHDPRMRTVTAPLAETNWLVGGLPGSGKTGALRVLALTAALDWRCQLWVFELKGSGDMAPLESVAHRYGSGPDDDTIRACRDALAEVHADLERRAAALRNLPRDLAPESKATPEAAARRDLGLFPLVFVLDEAQEAFTHPEHGKAITDLVTGIVKRGRALGVCLILGTQRPDRDSLPTTISANVGCRFALRTMDQTSGDMILGTGMYRAGYKPSLLSPRDKGVGYLAGHADDPQVVRSFYVTTDDAERVVARAKALRAAHGVLTGHAVGEEARPADDPLQVVRDVLAVWPASEPWAWSETLAAALAAWSGRYDGWTATDVTAALRKHGARPKQYHRTVDGERRNRRGFALEHVAAILDGAPPTQ